MRTRYICAGLLLSALIVSLGFLPLSMNARAQNPARAVRWHSRQAFGQFGRCDDGQSRALIANHHDEN